MPIPEVTDPWVAEHVTGVHERAANWLGSPGLAELIRKFGGPPITRDRNSLLELRAWSARNFDTRNGAERRDAPRSALTELQQQNLISAAGPLGLLRTPEPSVTAHDAVIVLAGATTGNRLRTALANEVLRSAPTTLLIGAASRRVLTEHEHGTDPDSWSDGTEWQNLRRMFDEGVQGIFADEWHEIRSDQGADLLRTTTSTGTVVELLIAPDRHGRRATTSEQLEVLAKLGAPEMRGSVLLVTSAIYVPYQFFAAAGALLKCATQRVEFIGTRTSTNGEPALLAQRVMQEVHAAIEAAIEVIGDGWGGEP